MRRSHEPRKKGKTAAGGPAKSVERSEAIAPAGSNVTRARRNKSKPLDIANGTVAPGDVGSLAGDEGDIAEQTVEDHAEIEDMRKKIARMQGKYKNLSVDVHQY
jgi:hypothetical protein